MPVRIVSDFIAFYKNARAWVYLALFYLIAGFGFYSSVIAAGNSNLSGTVGYIAIALLFLLPLAVPASKQQSALSQFTAVFVFFFCHLAAIMTIFAVIISNTGVFKFGLFANQLLMLTVFGAGLIAFYLFIRRIFAYKKISYLIMVFTAIIIVFIEYSSTYLFEDGMMHQILYSVSISKFFQGTGIGILDIKSVSFYIVLTALFVWLAMLSGKSLSTKQKRSRSITSGLVVVLVIIFCSTANGVEFGIDVTPGGFYSLGSETKEYIETVDKPISITVLETKEEFINKPLYYSYFLQAQKVLTGIDRHSKNISLSYQDIAALDAGMTESLNAEQGDILLEYGEEARLIKGNQLFEFTYISDQDDNLYMKIEASNVEQELCSAIDKLVDSSYKKVAFATGIEEHENVTVFQQALQKAGWEITNIHLSDENNLDDYRLLVIFAPAKDLDTQGAVNLEAFMLNKGQYGKNVIYVNRSGEDSELPNMNAFLEQWGIAFSGSTIEEGVLENTENSNALYGWNEYLDISFVQDIKHLENPVVIPYATPIQTNEEDTTLEYIQLLQSKDSSYTSADINEKTVYGPFSTAVVSIYNQPNVFGSGYTGVRGMVGTIASEQAFEPALFGQGVNSNAEYFTDLTFELAGENETGIPMYAKTLNMKAVTVTQGQRFAVFIIFVVLLPMFMLIGAGIVLFFRKQFKWKNSR